MKRKWLVAIGVIILLLITLFVTPILRRNYPAQVLYENGQMGIIVGKKGQVLKTVLIDNQKLDVYPTVSDVIEICYESYNLDNDYDNQIIINDTKPLNLISENNLFGKYVVNKIKILGLNIIDGKLILVFKSGKKDNENLNSFSLRNIYLKIGKKEIWSNEFPKDEYLNENINFGENDLNPAVRINYSSEETFTFDIDKKLLDVFGTILKEDSLNEKFVLSINNKETSFINESRLNVKLNIENKEIISQTKNLEVLTDENITFLEIKMDGIVIDNNFAFNEKSWANGEHTLQIFAKNKHGFKKEKMITFLLASVNRPDNNGLEYDIYQIGVSETLNSGINQIGVLVNGSDDETQELDDIYLKTAYCASPVITFVIKASDKTDFYWAGKVNSGRTAFMQIYNGDLGRWETVSTMFALGDETIRLGFDYQGLSKYKVDGKIYVRVSSAVTPLTKIITTHKIVHWTDMQYIIQLLTASGLDSAMGKKAKQILEDTVSYIIKEYQNGNLMYLALTGDMVQQQKGVDLNEWENFMTYVLNPLTESGVPVGLTSGNHDVGGVSSYHPDGVNALDDDLTYDYYNQHVGENVFNDFEYYGSAYKNNRSHYDLITVEGHQFLFLYLGWGSSTRYIHVSSQDINWAKTVLNA
ncbi:MAG: metallophosphoesterase, partial [Endomicrobiaceae bacterium]|nr:metallophosphoesterase [Endomicrobiaceae bacterium]